MPAISVARKCTAHVIGFYDINYTMNIFSHIKLDAFTMTCCEIISFCLPCKYSIYIGNRNQNVIFFSIITWDIALLQWGFFNIIRSLHGGLSALQFTIK
ncbi:hypothetical protein ASPFODRAFT_486854 [Aspergillus luchuensis CBS 106.47]|uniref:Uncharacterized protein n=1 Tax=Aspergillus luchuensis (strain CBS 106.47) TaxID=1137211 RepID=A0A1M3TRV1_ASPLC|nr:hypothetical protein ASPFODRAFT_486854 [Aspergillus luchuensis CBS 106.47]